MKGLSTHSNVFFFLLLLFDKCKVCFDHTVAVTLGQVEGLWHSRETEAVNTGSSNLE